MLYLQLFNPLESPDVVCQPSGLFFIPRRYKERAMTADECQRRAEEAKALAAQTQDLWERETYLRIATQWQLLAAHRAVKEHKPE